MGPHEPTPYQGSNPTIRRGLWALGFVVAAGIGIAGFSIATGLLVA